MINFDEFLSGYIAALLWSSADDNENALDNGDYLLSCEAYAVCVEDCRRFISIGGNDLTRYVHQRKPVDGYSASECAGHDFWLTRCCHGVGFWDRGLGELGDRLTALCGYGTQFPPLDAYAGDNYEVHLS